MNTHGPKLYEDFIEYLRGLMPNKKLDPLFEKELLGLIEPFTLMKNHSLINRNLPFSHYYFLSLGAGMAYTVNSAGKQIVHRFWDEQTPIMPGSKLREELKALNNIVMIDNSTIYAVKIADIEKLGANYDDGKFLIDKIKGEEHAANVKWLVRLREYPQIRYDYFRLEFSQEFESKIANRELLASYLDISLSVLKGLIKHPRELLIEMYKNNPL